MKKSIGLAVALFLGFGMAVSPASASVVFSYTTDATSYSASAGGAITVSVYLNEALTLQARRTSSTPRTACLPLVWVSICQVRALPAPQSRASHLTRRRSQTVSAQRRVVPLITKTLVAAGTNAAIQEAVGVASGGGSNPGVMATQINSSLYQVFLGSFTLTAGSTAGTDTPFTVTSLFNSPNIGLGGSNGNTTTETGSLDLDKNHATVPMYTGADGTINTFTVTVSGGVSTPEPSSMLLGGFAAGGMGFGAWRRRRAKLKAETAEGQDHQDRGQAVL